MKREIAHIESRRIAERQCMHTILEHMGWGELYYCYYKYNTGLKYLHIYLNGDKEAVAFMERNRIFWNWWKIHWTLRDEAFLNALPDVEQTKKRAIYKELHDVKALTNSLLPSAAMLDEAFAQMIGQINDELKQAAI